MADKKISELDTLSGVNLNDLDKFVVVDTSGSTTAAITVAQLKLGLGIDQLDSDLSVAETKLATIEVGADVTDTANVTAAGALMDSELTNINAVKQLNQGVSTTNSPNFAGLSLNGVEITSTAAEINFLDGVTSNVQTQLNGKASVDYINKVYQSVTRSVGTVYQNTTGHPLDVLVHIETSGSSSTFNLSMSPTSTLSVYSRATLASNSSGTVTFTVPVGWYYGWGRSSTAVSVTSWWERSA